MTENNDMPDVIYATPSMPEMGAPLEFRYGSYYYYKDKTTIDLAEGTEKYIRASLVPATVTPSDKAACYVDFCPECGCKEFKYAEWNKEHECVKCGQSWFKDVDYSNAIAGNLSERAALQEQDRDLIEALKKAQKMLADRMVFDIDIDKALAKHKERS